MLRSLVAAPSLRFPLLISIQLVATKHEGEAEQRAGIRDQSREGQLRSRDKHLSDMDYFSSVSAQALKAKGNTGNQPKRSSNMPKPTRSHHCGTTRKNMPETTTGSPGTYRTKHDHNHLTWRVIPPETPCPSADHDPLPLIRFRDCRNAVQVSESPVSD